MSRNSLSRFGMNPSVHVQRSKFNRDSENKLTFPAAKIVPFYVDEVLPGDTFNVKTAKVVRMLTPQVPFMDNLFLDTYYFFVPNRLVWKHWQAFMGENDKSPWLDNTEYSIPKVNSGDGFPIGSVADYMGIPTGVANLSVNALPFRALSKIYNDWFRDENLCDFEEVHDDDVNRIYGDGENEDGTTAELGGNLFTAAKYHDYFTSCLPAPQKGPAVSIPIAAVGDYLPVVPVEVDALDLNLRLAEWGLGSSSIWGKAGNLQWGPLIHDSETGEVDVQEMADNKGQIIPNGRSVGMGQGSGISPYVASSYRDDTAEGSYIPLNLGAVASSAFAATINELRMAFQIQKFYERAARGGTRYIETLKSHFGVTSPDSRLQRSEYLGGNRIPIAVNQVLSTGTSQSAGGTLGATGAMSQTVDNHSDFIHSFTEHGYIIGVMCVRYHHTYQQGLERMWSRSSMFDFYFPEFANIGEQGVLNKEIFAQGGSVVNPATSNPFDGEVFGYQEAWAEYRYKPSRVSGHMRSASEQSLDFWHLADDYESLPHLSQSWIEEDGNTLNRVLAVDGETAGFQFWADVLVKNTTTRPMPMFSIPGLIDHH